MTINIGYQAEWPATILSNFPFTPFWIDGIWCASAEGAIQAPKWPKHEDQIRVCALVGRKAKFAGNKMKKRIIREGTIFWLEKEISFRSDEHFDLIERFLWAKFTQWIPAQVGLLATTNELITHNLGHPESPLTSLPAKVFTEILHRIRTKLQKNKNVSHLI